jgi:hypothetical protein
MIIHGTVSFGGIAFEAIAFDMIWKKLQTVILLTCGLKERRKISEPCNAMVQCKSTLLHQHN